MVYRPPFIKQLDGTRFSGTNCTMASGSMAAIRHREGSNPAGSARWYPTPWYLRQLTGDKRGGTTLSQLDQVLNRYYHVDLEVTFGTSWRHFREQIKKGRGAVLQGGYSAIQHTVWSGSREFSGNHAIFVNEVRHNARLNRLEYLVYDPLCDGRRAGLDKGPSWIPENVLKEFASRLITHTTPYYTYHSGADNVWAAFTRDTEPVVTVHLATGATKLATPKNLYAKVDGARVRAGTTLTSKVIVKLDYEDRFVAYQKKNGQLVSGSRLWYGDRTGTRWVHSSVLKTTR